MTKQRKISLKKLQGQIFLDPETEEYVMKDEYLSGNVRKKLEFAKCAAKQDKKYNINVAALEEAQPEPLKAAEIDANLVQHGFLLITLKISWLRFLTLHENILMEMV